MSEPGQQRFVRTEEVAERLAISVRTLWRMVREGRFPGPIRYNRKLVRWPASVVDAWLEAERQKNFGT
jgi:excisionase family DNA binding protein